MITRTCAILAALATAAVTGCATRAAAEWNPPAAPAAATVDAAQVTYDQVIDKVYGTPDQRQEADEANWLRTQLATASCMAKTGLHYQPVPFQNLPDTGVAPGDLLAFAPARQDFGVGRRVQAFAAAGELTQPALDGASVEQNARYAQAMSVCATGQVMDTGTTKGQEILDGELVAALSKVEQTATPNLAGDYRACLAVHGLQARDLSELYVQVEQAYPPISYEKASDATKVTGWAQATAFETAAAATDASCRAAAIDVALVAAAPVLARFAKVHAAELDAVATGWARATTDVLTLRAKVN